MYSPATAEAGPVFVTARSALRVTVVVTKAEESLAVVGSVGDWLPTEPLLVIEVAVEEGLICARIRNVFVAPAASAPTAVEPPHTPPVDGSQGVEPRSEENTAPFNSRLHVAGSLAL